MMKTIYLHHIITKNDIKPDFDKLETNQRNNFFILKKIKDV